MFGWYFVFAAYPVFAGMLVTLALWSLQSIKLKPVEWVPSVVFHSADTEGVIPVVKKPTGQLLQQERIKRGWKKI